jgi:hypothetical protein
VKGRRRRQRSIPRTLTIGARCDQRRIRRQASRSDSSTGHRLAVENSGHTQLFAMRAGNGFSGAANFRPFAGKPRDDASSSRGRTTRAKVWPPSWHTASNITPSRAEDPAGRRDGPNLYLYALNQPAHAIDPLGLQATTAPQGMPSNQTPPGCTATGWINYDTDVRSKPNKRKWKLERATEIKIPAFITGRTKMDKISLGFCVCEWVSVGIVWVAITTRYWSRTLTCCDQSRNEVAVTTQENCWEQPVLGARRVTTKAPVAIGGCQCLAYPPSGAL